MIEAVFSVISFAGGCVLGSFITLRGVEIASSLAKDKEETSIAPVQVMAFDPETGLARPVSELDSEENIRRTDRQDQEAIDSVLM